MSNFLKVITLLFFIAAFQGCIVFHTVSYEVKLNEDRTGTVNLLVNNIKSDALNVSELEEDKNQLFNFMWKSDDFIEQMKEEGKFITDRQLYIADDKLNGKLSFDFREISTVEGIQYQEPFYFLTLGLEDSIVSTNGEIIYSDNLKRIMWDSTMTTLQFEMFSADVEVGSLVDLKKYLDNN